MTYEPITNENKEEWIKWLASQVDVLTGQSSNPNENQIFRTPEGDVQTGKDLVGNLLALLTNEPVTIY